MLCIHAAEDWSCQTKIFIDRNLDQRDWRCPNSSFFGCTNRTLHKFVLWQLEFHWTKNLGSNVGWPWTVFLEGTSAELNRCHRLLSQRNFNVFLRRWFGITLGLTDGELDADRAAEIPAAASLTAGWKPTWWLQTRFHHRPLLCPLWSLRRNCSLIVSSCSEQDDIVYCFQPISMRYKWSHVRENAGHSIVFNITGKKTDFLKRFSHRSLRDIVPKTTKCAVRCTSLRFSLRNAT